MLLCLIWPISNSENSTVFSRLLDQTSFKSWRKFPLVSIHTQESRFHIFFWWPTGVVYYRPQTKFAKVMFLHLSVILLGGGHACMAGGHACMAGGMCGRGCVWQGGMHGRGHAWHGGVCGREACMSGGMCCRGACMAGGCAWVGGMHGRGACMPHMPPDTMRYGQSMRGWYASYWNAFLFTCASVLSLQRRKWYFSSRLIHSQNVQEKNCCTQAPTKPLKFTHAWTDHENNIIGTKNEWRHLKYNM